MLFGLFYFLDVFVGMFVLQREYNLYDAYQYRTVTPYPPAPALNGTKSEGANATSGNATLPSTSVANVTTTYDVVSGYDSEERQSAILHKPYDIIEFVLLAIFIVENIVKLAFTTRATKSVSNLTFTSFIEALPSAFKRSLSFYS